MNGRKAWQITLWLSWVLAFGGTIGRLVLVIAGHPMGRTDQILWLVLVIAWIGISYVKSMTIANQRRTIRLLENRQQRDRAWLS